MNEAAKEVSLAFIDRELDEIANGIGSTSTRKKFIEWVRTLAHREIERDVAEPSPVPDSPAVEEMVPPIPPCAPEAVVSCTVAPDGTLVAIEQEEPQVVPSGSADAKGTPRRNEKMRQYWADRRAAKEKSATNNPGPSPDAIASHFDTEDRPSGEYDELTEEERKEKARDYIEIRMDTKTPIDPAEVARMLNVARPVAQKFILCVQDEVLASAQSHDRRRGRRNIHQLVHEE